MNRRGLSLVSTLVVAVLAFMIMATVAASCLTHLTIATSQRNAEVARSLAERAALIAYGRCARNFSDTSPLNLTLNESPEGYGLVCFGANTWGVPLSQNNLNGSSSTSTPGGHVVPPYTLRILAEGRYQDKVKRCELVAQAAYPYAITCGNLTGDNITVGGINWVGAGGSGGSLNGGWTNLNENRKINAQIFASGRNLAVNITSGSIGGDIRTRGTIAVGNATVLGGLFPYSDFVRQPYLTSEPPVPTGPLLTSPVNNNVGFINLSSLANLQLNNSVVGLLPSTVISGDVQLTGSCRVMAQGNLAIAGRVRSLGADSSYISAGGDVYISAQKDPSALPHGGVALRCRNLIMLGDTSGGPGIGPIYKGTIYCANITATNVTILGGVHCAFNATLTNSTVIYSPEAQDISGTPNGNASYAFDRDPIRNLPLPESRLRVVWMHHTQDGDNP